jgi:hypothetical protein
MFFILKHRENLNNPPAPLALVPDFITGFRSRLAKQPSNKTPASLATDNTTVVVIWVIIVLVWFSWGHEIWR